MRQKRTIIKLDRIVKERKSKDISKILHPFYIVKDDNSINISSEAIKLLGANPDDYENTKGVPDIFQGFLVKDKIAYTTDERLFTPEGKFKGYPDAPISFIKFWQ